MYDNDACGSEHRGGGRARLRRAGLRAAALACLALVAAACSSPASPGNGAGPAHGSNEHSALAFSRCMRAHGITGFPDPDSQGNFALPKSGPGTKFDPQSPQFKAANNACKSLMPGGAMSPAQQAAAKAQSLKYSRCMRAHGISDFPDPNSQGGFEGAVPKGSSSDLDPHNPRFQAANKACQRGNGGSVSTSGGGS
jgi:hypothetical protein